MNHCLKVAPCSKLIVFDRKTIKSHENFRSQWNCDFFSFTFEVLDYLDDIPFQDESVNIYRHVESYRYANEEKVIVSTILKYMYSSVSGEKFSPTGKICFYSFLIIDFTDLTF